MSAIWTIGAGNPKRRKSKKRRSAKQKAATVRMLAGLKRKRGGRKSVSAAPVTHKRRSKRRGTSVARRRSGRRAMRSMSGMGRGIVGSALSLAKAGAIGAGGAVAVDFLMAQAGRVLPATFMTKVDPTTGGINFSYYGSKGLLAVALGTFGRKLPGIGKYASEMAAGSMVTMMYEVGRAMMPVSVAGQLGYYNAAPIVGAYVGRSNKVAGYVSDAARIRTVGANGPGANVASMLMRARA